MTKELIETRFVEPSPKPELDGEIGLYLHEIAKSLNTADYKIRQKIRKSGFLDRIEAQGFIALPFGRSNDSNGLEYTDYVLDVDAAKFLVGKWNSEVGDAYLAYLIKLERQVDQLQKQAEEDPLTKQMLNSIKIRQEQLSQAKALKEVTGRVDKMEATQPKIIKNEVEKIIVEKTDFPEECIRVDHIGPKYFPGLAKTKVSAFLNAIRHPKKTYIYRGEQGSIPSDAFIEEGMEQAAERFYAEREFIKETEKSVFWFHPLIGSMREGKISHTKSM